MHTIDRRHFVAALLMPALLSACGGGGDTKGPVVATWVSAADTPGVLLILTLSLDSTGAYSGHGLISETGAEATSLSASGRRTDSNGVTLELSGGGSWTLIGTAAPDKLSGTLVATGGQPSPVALYPAPENAVTGYWRTTAKVGEMWEMYLYSDASTITGAGSESIFGTGFGAEFAIAGTQTGSQVHLNLGTSTFDGTISADTIAGTFTPADPGGTILLVRQ